MLKKIRVLLTNFYVLLFSIIVGDKRLSLPKQVATTNIEDVFVILTRNHFVKPLILIFLNRLFSCKN
jgi:hypothetical protein